MKTLITLVSVALLALTLASTAIAQKREGLPRNQTGGVATTPANGIFKIVSVDSYARIVQMQGPDGATADVYVGDGIYDLSKLSAGDRVRVNFLVPDGLGKKLSAASIWPVK